MTNFHEALATQADRVCTACADLARAPTGEALNAAERFERAFNDALDTLSQGDFAIAAKRVRKQAKHRAEANGVDIAFAEDEAERCLREGMTHEAALVAACGEYRPKEIAA